MFVISRKFLSQDGLGGGPGGGVGGGADPPRPHLPVLLVWNYRAGGTFRPFASPRIIKPERQKKLMPRKSQPIPSAQISTSARSLGSLRFPALKRANTKRLMGTRENHIHAPLNETFFGSLSLFTARQTRATMYTIRIQVIIFVCFAERSPPAVTTAYIFCQCVLGVHYKRAGLLDRVRYRSPKGM